MTQRFQHWFQALVFATAFLAAPQAYTEAVKLRGDLKGVNEVPPVQSPASGSIVATFDLATKTLRWTITYSGLSALPEAIHFHGPADVTRNAGIVLPITESLKSPIIGSAVLTESQTADLLAGRWYLNVHTTSHPAGELRAQVMRID
jgi:hypothetical protein